MYSFESRVRYSETDENGKLTLLSVLNYFQDCSTFQSEDLGVGIQMQKETGNVWVLNYWQIDILRFPVLGELIRIGTHAYSCKGFLGLRNFYMEDPSGEKIAAANSVWSYISAGKGTPVHIPEQIEKAYGKDPKLDMEYEPRKIAIDPGAVSSKGEAFEVKRIHLDANHHVNNGQYVRMALDAAPESLEAGRLRAEYRREAHLGDKIQPVLYQSPLKTAVSLNGEDEKPFAVVEFRCLN